MRCTLPGRYAIEWRLTILRRRRALARFLLAEAREEAAALRWEGSGDDYDDCMCPLCYTPPAPDDVGTCPLRTPLREVARVLPRHHRAASRTTGNVCDEPTVPVEG